MCKIVSFLELLSFKHTHVHTRMQKCMYVRHSHMLVSELWVLHISVMCLLLSICLPFAILFLIKTFFRGSFNFLYECFACMYVHLVHTVSVEVRSECQIPGIGFTDGCELPSMWMLGIKTGSSARATSVLDC